MANGGWHVVGLPQNWFVVGQGWESLRGVAVVIKDVARGVRNVDAVTLG